MSEWIDIKDQEPVDEQEVIYFFDICGVFRGIFTKEYYSEEDYGPGYEDIYSCCFSSKSGFLCDDVTHWMPDDGRAELPKGPESLTVAGVTVNGWPLRKNKEY